MFVMTATFNFNLRHFGSREAAECHYLDYHVPLARRLPGLRQYVIGRPTDFAGAEGDRQRAALLVFDDRDALRAAYRSTIGRELREDEKRLIADAVVTFVDAQDVLAS